MTIAHTLATPAPTSRWLLLGSLALNLFLIGLMVALITREPPATDRSPAGADRWIGLDLAGSGWRQASRQLRRQPCQC